MMKFKIILTALLALFLTGCTSSAEARKVVKRQTIHQYQSVNHPLYEVEGKTYSTKSGSAAHYSKNGRASYYHNKFNGRRTASGEVYNSREYTAAHRSLPLGSYALVTNLRNNRKVVVKINDRGPYHGSRIIDLSRAAASDLGMLNSGVGNVKIEKLHIVKN